MWEIYSHLFKQVAVILVIVFIFRKSKLFSTIMLKRETTVREKIFLSFLFGIIGIHGTYGFPVENGVANTRAVGIIVAGLVGGPAVGVGAGLVAGLHRFSLGGLTIVAALVSAMLQGFLAGLCSERLHNRKVMWPHAFLIGVALELLHMVIIIINGPFNEAVEVVKVIGPPMTIANPAAVAMFVAFLEDVYEEQKRIQANATQMALDIATKILPFMRRGLNRHSSSNASLVISEMAESVDAVSFTSNKQVLALSRKEGDRYILQDTQEVIGQELKNRLAADEVSILNVKSEVRILLGGYAYGSSVVVPLKDGDDVVGALILFKSKEYGISAFEVELANGLRHLISTQIEISRADAQTELVAQAEIRVLQAQINPHFLFNALNTIAYYCVKQPETAKELISHLADFYRSNIVNFNKLVTLRTELAHVKSYVEIEAARFQGKLNVAYDISGVAECLVPPLILQPLVENAIKHGILPKGGGGTIVVSSTTAAGVTYVTVEDDGVGISQEVIGKILEYDPNSRSIGLCNVNKRLKNIYGNEYGLIIESTPGVGTRIMLPIPKPKRGLEEADDDQGVGS